MAITKVTSSVLADNAAQTNLNAQALITLTKAISSSNTLNITGAVAFGNTLTVTGAATFSSTLTVTNNIQSSAGNVSCAAAGSLSILGRSRIYSPSDGTLQFRTNDNTLFASVSAAGLTLATTPLAASSGGTGLSSLGTGVAAFLQTPTSDNLRAALTDDTGTGANVFANNPTLTSPAISGGTIVSNLSGSTGYSVTNLTGIQRVIRTTTLTRPVATPTADPLLTLPVIAGNTYRMKYFLAFSGLSSAQMDAGLNGPAYDFVRGFLFRSGNVVSTTFISTNNPFVTFGIINTGLGAVQSVNIDLVIKPTANGNMNVTWGVYAGSLSGSILPGSYIESEIIG
jgi:hypothetical protein